MGRMKKKVNKEEICDDYCFQCKDGGSLRICDYKDCLQAYHPKCVEKDDSFLASEVPWTCSWHFCLNCNGTPKFHCFCCPKAICGICLYDFEFAVIGRKGGFCNHCSTLAGFIEGVDNSDPDQGKIDFDEPETYEYYFKLYWEIVKRKEGLTSIHVSQAIELLNKGRNSKDFSDMSAGEDSSEVEDEYEPESSNDRKENKRMSKWKRNRENSIAMKRKMHSNKEFNGWASNLLSDFLDFIGIGATDELSQHDVTAIVIQYCYENKLFDPVKKKKVVCDARLKSLLGRKSVQKNSIYNLLTPHFTVNFEQSEDEYKHTSENEDGSGSISCKKQRRSNSTMKPQNNEAVNVHVHRQGCFASMVAQNIKLLYLNRNLMEKLLEQPETFDAKVIGSFVRIRADPYDYLQKNPYMLVKVTGVKRTSGNDEVTKEVLLQVSNMQKDISICQLSNDYFSEEECDDLQQRVKDGRLERPSVMEFKEKSRSLHEDITKQWIVKELHRLEKLIDQANEKGWRRQLYECIERKQMLENPAEQSQLLHEFPEIIADETEVQPSDSKYFRKDEVGSDLLPESDCIGLLKPSTKDSGGDGTFSCLNDVADFTEHEQQCQGSESEEQKQQHHTVSSHVSNDVGIHQALINESVTVEVKEDCPDASHPELVSGQPTACIPQAQSNSVLLEGVKNKQNEPASEFIEVSDDDEQHNPIGVNEKTVDVSDDEEQHNTIGVSKQTVEISDDEEQDTTIRVSKKTVVISDDKDLDNTIGVSKQTVEISDDEEQDTTIGMSRKQ